MQVVDSGAMGPPSELHLPAAMTDSVSTMTSSMTSSLTSPGDSGVALLDSEAEVTSVSESIDVLEGPTPAEENRTKLPTFKLESMTNSDIANGNTHLESNAAEEIVFRSRTKSNRHSRHSTDSKQKRVSFHEELIKTDQPNEDEINLKQDETKDSYNWYEETLKPNSIQRSESSSSGGSSLANLANELIEEFATLDCATKTSCDNSTPLNDKVRIRSAPLSKSSKEPPRLRSEKEQSVAGVLSAVRSLIAGSPKTAARSIQSLPVTERGVPEGQEDPPLSASTLDLYHHADVAERLRDGEPLKDSSADSDCGNSCAQPASPRRLPGCRSRSPHLRQTRRFSSNNSNSSVLREAPSKSCLVNRFLRSLTEKKLQNSRCTSATTPRRRAVQRPPRQSLYIKGARPVEELSKEILDELEEEIRSASPPVHTTCTMELAVTPVIRERLLADVVETRIESPCKMYQVRLCSEKNKSEVMLAVLTERAIYLINHLWKASHVLLLAHLDSILLGPGSHWVRLYSNNGVPRTQKAALKKMTLLLGDVASTRQLLSHIELAVRRLSLPGRRIPAVHRFSLEDLASSPWSAVLLGETVHHSAVVHAADVCPSPPCTPLGPQRRGYFMFSHINGRGHLWTAGFFVLKAGVLYQFASEDKRMPVLSLHMANLKPRLASHSRPHTLEVGHLLLAAPDEATSNDWLRALLRAASGDGSECPVEEQQTLSHVATLILTEERILLLAGLDSSAPVLLVAPLNDLVSMQTGDQAESWCVLDLACREACESVGDFVVYFTTSSEMQSFKDSMCRLRPAFQEIWTKIPHSSPLRPRCQKMQSQLSSSWSVFLSTLRSD